MTLIYLLCPPSKQKSVKVLSLLSTIRSLLCLNLVYNVEKSKVETEVAFLRLLSPFIASVTGLLFCTTQKVLAAVKNLHLSLYVCIRPKNKRKIYSYSSGWRFYKRFRRRYIGLLCILGIQYILDNPWFLIGMVSMPNLIFNSLILYQLYHLQISH